MDNIRISTKQLFALITLFELGTALVVPIGLTAGQDLWLSILFALLGGILLFLVYEYLYRQYPELTFSGYTRKILGNYIGWVISLLYVPFFIYCSARDLREAGDLLVTSSFDRTPIFMINALMIATIIYVLYKGIEVFARLGEIYILVFIFLGVLGSVLVLISNIVDLKNLLPVLGNGLKPVLKDAYPSIFIFPFGEMVCFTTILPYLNYKHKAKKTGIYALVFSGVILSFTHAIEVAVLGPDMYSRTTFPLFTTVTKVNIADFIQRLDPIVMLTLIIGDFFKIAIYLYAGINIGGDLFKVKKVQSLVLPTGTIVLIASMTTASNYLFHIEEGVFFTKMIMPVYCVVIPATIFVVHLIRKRFNLF